MRKLILALLGIIVLTGCAIPYNRLKHNDVPYITKGMYSLFKSVGRLVRKPYTNNHTNQLPYIVNGTMPANEFADTATIYSDKLVSYSARIEDPDTDLVRLIWDYRSQQFGGDAPQPLLFPYPQDAEHINSRYYIKFFGITRI